MKLRRFINRHKGKRCEAIVWCLRNPVGSVIVIPEDENGKEIGQLCIWVCGKHKVAAIEAAEEYGKNYERKYMEAK